MFRGKNEKAKDEKQKQKMARALLGKGPIRRVFSFICAPYIQVELKYLAKQLNVPLFAATEHALELGTNQIEAALKDLEERELLIKHLTEVHVGDKVVESLSRYDREKAEVLDMQRERKFRIENAVKRMIEFLFKELGANKLEIHTKATNSRSIAVAERCGFTKEAHIRERGRTNEGAVVDLLYFGLLRSEFEF